MKISLLALSAIFTLPCTHAAVIDFGDVSPTTAHQSGTMQGFYYNGSENAGTPPTAGTYDTVWSSNGVNFDNSYTHDATFGGFWNHWAFSNVVDSATPGFGNQYAAYSGGGADSFGNTAAGDTYAVATGITNAILLSSGQRNPQSLMVTNNTYTALSMLNGDAFAKQFGGPSGDDPDFLILNIEGLDGMGWTLGNVSVYLADYRFVDNSQDFILEEWASVDLSSFGSNVHELRFSLDSSDVGGFGINTPLYFSLDNLVTIPEPSTVGLFALSAGLLLRRKRQ